MERSPAVYILASQKNGTLYVGVTSNLAGRAWQHRNKSFGGFTQKYNVDRLVWFESHEEMHNAIDREKELKRFRRKWKIELIESLNPNWSDLSEQFE